MGGCVTKPGCPPCYRFRGASPQWKDDLCNKNISIVQGRSEDTVTIEPMELVKNAIHEAEEVVPNAIEKVKEWEEDVKEVIIILVKIAEIMICLVLAFAAMYFCYRVYRVCRACYICKPKSIIPSKLKAEEKADTEV